MMGYFRERSATTGRARRRRVVVAAGVVAAGLAAALGTMGFGAMTPVESLRAVEAKVATDYGSVAHLSPDALQTRLRRQDAGSGQIVFVDVREAEEYAVSRIDNAVRVAPGANAEQVVAKLGDVSGKTIVLYCSVGVRSSQLAARVQETLKAAGARGVYNLSGGIFRWHNEQRRLADARGPTRFVHPYDTWWAKHVARQDAVRYSPLPE